jgi:hypothetical protein
LLATAACLLASPGSWADNTKRWDTASQVLTLVGPLAAGAAAWQQNDTEGMRQLGLSVGSVVVAAEVLKNTVHSTRPDGSDNQSFPSRHTAIAFAAAAYMDQRYGDALGAWMPAALYGTAALAGVARVQADKHHAVDVLAGGAMGYGITRYWTESRQGGRLSVLPAPGGVALGWATAF